MPAAKSRRRPPRESPPAAPAEDVLVRALRLALRDEPDPAVRQWISMLLSGDDTPRK